ncbi:MAG: hypothetical protein AAFN50_05470 [Pseudomonadota bacterium]
MTTERAWKDRAEMVGIFAIVASLIFVGGELRQNAIATKAAMNAEIANAFVDLNLVVASSPELTQRLAEFADDPAAAPREAQIQMLGIWRAVFHTWSNVHRQHLNGTIDPAIYESVVQEVSTYAAATANNNQNVDVVRRQAFMRWAWESERFIFNPDFQVFVDGILGLSR